MPQKASPRHPLEKSPERSDKAFSDTLRMYWSGLGLPEAAFEEMWAAYGLERQIRVTADKFRIIAFKNLRYKWARIGTAPSGEIWVFFVFGPGQPNEDPVFEAILDQAALQDPPPKLEISYHFDDAGDRVIDWIRTP